jgi:hypothetical protein
MEADKDIEVMLDGLDENNISSLLIKSVEICNVIRKLKDLDDMIKIKIRSYLKERNWPRYYDRDVKISVSVDVIKTENINKEQLKLIITPAQFAQITNIKSKEHLSIIDKDAIKRMKKYVKK